MYETKNHQKIATCPVTYIMIINTDGECEYQGICILLIKIHISITISGYGTTHKHVNYEYKHIALMTSSSGIDEDCVVATLFAGINTAPNHTSVEQFEGWMALIEELSKVYKESRLGAGHEFEHHHFTS